MKNHHLNVQPQPRHWVTAGLHLFPVPPLGGQDANYDQALAPGSMTSFFFPIALPAVLTSLLRGVWVIALLHNWPISLSEHQNIEAVLRKKKNLFHKFKPNTPGRTVQVQWNLNKNEILNPPGFITIRKKSLKNTRWWKKMKLPDCKLHFRVNFGFC